MFGTKNSAKNAKGVETLIARNTSIEGRVNFNGILTIEGRVVGDVISSDDKNSVVRITSDGKVEGEVRSPDVIINGHVKGDVHAAGQLVLASDAVVDGNVHYNLIEMEKGAQINGNMVHSVEPVLPSGKSDSPPKIGKRVRPSESLDKDAEQPELAVS